MVAFTFGLIVNLVVSYVVTSRDIEEIYALALTASFAETMFVVCIFSALSLTGAFFKEAANIQMFLQSMIMGEQQQVIIRQKTQNTNLQKKLLQSMLPDAVVDQLQVHNFVIESWEQLRSLSHRHFGVCIMFAELDDFMTFSAQVDPPRVMQYLNALFLRFDGLCDENDVYKVETVGDQYVAAVGVVTGQMRSEQVREDDHDGSTSLSSRGPDTSTSAEDASVFNTKQMIQYAKAIVNESMLVDVPEGADVCPRLRVGIHTGPCMSGIVGTKNLRFCLFGDTMNTAARMEQKSIAECIHATQDVVDLVPDESWEKRKKIDFKGKGLMQTYLLRVKTLKETNSLASQTSLHPLDRFVSLNPSMFEEVVGRSMSESAFARRMATPSKSTNDVESNSAFARRMAMPSESTNDVEPVSSSVYRNHTQCFGLFFRKMRVEHVYLNGQASLDKNMVFAGYATLVVILCGNLLYGWLRYTILCSESNTTLIAENLDAKPERWVCFLYFGSEPFTNGTSPTVDYHDLARSSAFNMTPACAGMLFGLVMLGCVSHWFIHRSTYFVHRKYWAFLNTWFWYFTVLLTMLLCVILTTRSNPNAIQWTESLWFITVMMNTLFTVFARTGFLLHVCMILIEAAITLTWGLIEMSKLQEHPTFKEIDGEFDLDQFEMGLAPPKAISTMTQLAFFTLCFDIILIIGSYMEDITNRKRFLQRILMVRQQDEIIREKTQSERVQNDFLESILPSNIVEGLQKQQSIHSSMRFLCHSHMGVSMLYADLVGFTAFSAQVDPFKVMVFLNDLFQVFDGLCDDFNVYKVETVGDCYVGTVGVATGEMVTEQVSPDAPDSSSDLAASMLAKENASDASFSASNAADLIGFAKAMVLCSRQVVKPVVGTPATLRVGIHSVSYCALLHFLPLLLRFVKSTDSFSLSCARALASVG